MVRLMIQQLKLGGDITSQSNGTRHLLARPSHCNLARKLTIFFIRSAATYAASTRRRKLRPNANAWLRVLSYNSDKWIVPREVVASDHFRHSLGEKSGGRPTEHYHQEPHMCLEFARLVRMVCHKVA